MWHARCASGEIAKAAPPSPAGLRPSASPRSAGRGAYPYRSGHLFRGDRSGIELEHLAIGCVRTFTLRCSLFLFVRFVISIAQFPRPAHHFVYFILAFFARASGRPLLEFSPAAEAVLQAYPWPGNIRELRNAIERVVILWPAQIVEPQAFSDSIASHTPAGPQLGGDYSLEMIEREHILLVLARVATLEEAAHILNIDPSTLWRKRQKYEA